MNHNAQLNAAKKLFQRYEYAYIYVLSYSIAHSNGYHTADGSVREEMRGGVSTISHRAAPFLHWHLSSRSPSIFVPQVCL